MDRAPNGRRADTRQTCRAFLGVFGPPRNLQPHYNIAPTDTVDVTRLDKHGARELVSMRWGLVPAWWKKSLKEVPATFKRARGIRRRQTDVPHCLQGAALHRAGERVFRMDWREGSEAAASLHSSRRLAPPRLRRSLGSLEGPAHGRMAVVQHDHRVGCIRLDGALSGVITRFVQNTLRGCKPKPRRRGTD